MKIDFLDFFIGLILFGVLLRACFPEIYVPLVEHLK